MGAIASQITSLTTVYSTVYSDADQRKHQSSALLVFCVWNSPVNYPHKWPVTRKMFPFDDVIMMRENNTGIDSMQFASAWFRSHSDTLLHHWAQVKLLTHDITMHNTVATARDPGMEGMISYELGVYPNPSSEFSDMLSMARNRRMPHFRNHAGFKDQQPRFHD